MTLVVKEYLSRNIIQTVMQEHYENKQEQLKAAIQRHELDNEGTMTALLVARNQSRAIQLSEKRKLQETVPAPTVNPSDPFFLNQRDIFNQASFDFHNAPFKSNRDHVAKKIKINEESTNFERLSFQLAEQSKRYIIRGFDVSEYFYQFQLSLKQRTNKLHLETHVHSVL